MLCLSGNSKYSCRAIITKPTFIEPACSVRTGEIMIGLVGKFLFCQVRSIKSHLSLCSLLRPLHPRRARRLCICIDTKLSVAENGESEISPMYSSEISSCTQFTACPQTLLLDHPGARHASTEHLRLLYNSPLVTYHPSPLHLSI